MLNFKEVVKEMIARRMKDKFLSLLVKTVSLCTACYVDGGGEDTGLLPRESSQGMYISALRLTFRAVKVAVKAPARCKVAMIYPRGCLCRAEGL